MLSSILSLGAQKEEEMLDPVFVREATEKLVGLSVADVERDLILATLRQMGGNRTHAAKMLGISIRTIRNKLGSYSRCGIDVPEAH